LEYVEGGGTLIVQYNKFEFNQAQYAPYPAKVSSDRVTDEHAPVKVLVPDHPVFNHPNRITDAAWEHWVQERGLYFLGERDPKYVDLLETTDPFPFNAGAKRGALVEARVGSGRWVYVGLNLWRQLTGPQAPTSCSPTCCRSDPRRRRRACGERDRRAGRRRRARRCHRGARAGGGRRARDARRSRDVPSEQGLWRSDQRAGAGAISLSPHRARSDPDALALASSTR